MADSTTAAADRLEIEALVREWSDEEWSVFWLAKESGFQHVRASAHTNELVSVAKVLAYLDGVVAWVFDRRRNRLQRTIRSLDFKSIPFSASDLVACENLCSWRLATTITEPPCGTRVRWEITPLGRAVLRRAKEQGHA